MKNNDGRWVYTSSSSVSGVQGEDCASYLSLTLGHPDVTAISQECHPNPKVLDEVGSQKFWSIVN